MTSIANLSLSDRQEILSDTNKHIYTHICAHTQKHSHSHLLTQVHHTTTPTVHASTHTVFTWLNAMATISHV